MNTFNPSHYVLTARQTWDKRKEFLAYIQANKHLALPFHVEGLQKEVPPTYPGETAIILARGHHGKSTVMKDIIWKAQQLIEGRQGYAVALVSHEDVAERTAGQLARRYGSELEYQDDQFIHIGRSFGMKSEQVADMHMSNIITALEYGRSRFGENMQYSLIANDYIQIQPPDPFRREMTNKDQRRLQVADDVKRWCDVAVQFSCSVFLASQALMKIQRANYTETMKIPGPADVEEAKEIYNYPDVVYAYWQPKHDYPIWSWVEDGSWNFQVRPNLVFVRIVKRRYAEELGYNEVVGRIYPLLLQPNGDFLYDKDYHRSILTGKAKEDHGSTTD